MGEIVNYTDLSVYLINEYSKSEHDYTEVLYRTRYIDEQLIAIGKQESLKNFRMNCMPHIYFSSQEKIFLMAFFQNNLYAFLTCLTLCKNPFEYAKKIIKSSDVYIDIYDGIFCENAGINYIIKPSCHNLDFCINSENYVEIQGETTNFETSCYRRDFHDESARDLMIRWHYKSDCSIEVTVVEENVTEFINFFIKKKNADFYSAAISCMDLFEKVLNKRIDIENLQKQYERKMSFFYED